MGLLASSHGDLDAIIAARVAETVNGSSIPRHRRRHLTDSLTHVVNRLPMMVKG